MYLLLIGNCNHPLLIGYARELKKTNKSLHLSIYSTQKIKHENRKYYDCCEHIRLKQSIIPGLNLVSIISQFFYLIIKSKRFDFIHIQFVNYYFFYLIPFLKFRRSKIVLTFWGSDYILFKNYPNYFLKLIVQSAYKISFASQKYLTDMLALYPTTEKKISICRFGLDPITKIKEFNSKILARKSLNLPNDKIIVCVGYNYSQNQQHFLIIDSLESDEKLVLNKNKYLFVFPLTYGDDKVYLNKLKKRIQNSVLHCICFENFMTNDEVAFLRLASDVFIQLQKHDQFSGSMSEHLFAKNFVITGRWLNYIDLKELNIYFYEIDDFNELSSFIKIVSNIEYAQISQNSNKIQLVSDWQFLISNWIKLYE